MGEMTVTNIFFQQIFTIFLRFLKPFLWPLKHMGFAHQGLWVMGYHGLMGYGVQIPAHQLGGPKMAWVFRGYGFSEAWVKRVSTLFLKFPWLLWVLISLPPPATHNPLKPIAWTVHWGVLVMRVPTVHGFRNWDLDAVGVIIPRHTS